jgi:hypothetical protein
MSSTPPPYHGHAQAAPASSSSSSGIAGIQHVPQGNAQAEAIAFIQGLQLPHHHGVNFMVHAPMAQIHAVPQAIMNQLPIFPAINQPIFQMGGGAFQVVTHPPPQEAQGSTGASFGSELEPGSMSGPRERSDSNSSVFS